MTLHISSREAGGLAEASQAMLSPLAFDCPRAWCEAVTVLVKDLLGGDTAGVVLPLQSGLLISADNPAAPAYPEVTAPLDERLHFVRRAARLGAYDRQTLFAHAMPLYLRSAYYNEWVVPNRFFDAIGLGVVVGTGTSLQDVAQLLVHHDRAGPTFGDHGVALLRLLLPSFRAGVIAWRRYAQRGSSLGELLDELGQAVLVCDEHGNRLHANAVLRQLLGYDATPEVLQGEMASLARALTQTRRLQSDRMQLPSSEKMVRTKSATYRLSVGHAPENQFGPAAAIIVSVERMTPVWPSIHQVMRAHGLTRAQAAVALLLARGHTNDEIAHELVISPATARNHTARVRERMGVTSRAKIGSKLLGISLPFRSPA